MIYLEIGDLLIRNLLIRDSIIIILEEIEYLGYYRGI
jgi:hypothetical protein